MSVCSIVIRAYNEEEHIGRLLLGILQQTVKDVQIILVDSGSTDATVAIASRYPVEVVNIKPQDFTFGRSLNLGISRARAPFVVLASAHVYPVYPDWLERILEPFGRADVALTYGKQRAHKTSQFSENQVWQQWYPDQPRLNQKHPFCNNANAAIRREIWEKHPYDETLSGLEDLDWARWAQEQSYGIVYVPEAEVIHLHQENWHGIYNRYRREAMAFKTIYPQESFSLGDFLRLWLVNVYNDLRVAGSQRVLRDNWWKIIAYRWSQFRGTYHGYRRSDSLTWELRQAFYFPRMGQNGEQSAQRQYKPIRYHDQDPITENQSQEENE